MDARRQQLRADYVARVNCVMDYIEENLDQPLSLDELAAVAAFSPYHFHRVFSAIAGESLYGFIQRVRLEKAAARLLAHPTESATTIALDCGFSGSSAFARAFKETFGMSASEWRAGGFAEERKKRQAESKPGYTLGNPGQAFHVEFLYPQGASTQTWRVEMNATKLQANVEVKDLPEITVAYLRHVGPYKGDSTLFERLFGELMKWAGPRGLLRFPETKMLTIYHDNPDITDENKLRMDVCITVPADTTVQPPVGKMTLPAGRYAVAHFDITPAQYQDAWNTLFGGWLPESGYQPGDGPSYELYLSSPEDSPDGRHQVDIVVPVKPL